MSESSKLAAGSASPLRLVPLFALSAVVLSLEIFQSRLVAYSVQNMMIYAVIGIALMGFGAAGSLVAVRQDWLRTDRLPTALAWSAWSLSVTIVISHALFVRLSPLLLRIDAVSLAIAGLLCLPFVSAGSVVTLALSTGSSVGGAYAANLIGSGLGCFLPLLLLGPLDGEHLLGLHALLAWLSALPYTWMLPRRSRALQAASAASLVLSVASLVWAPRVFPIQPDPAPWGQLQGQYDYAAKHGIGVTKRYDRWNPTGRIEVVQFDHVPGGPEPYYAMFYAQDSSAGSTLFRWNGRSKSQQPKEPAADSVVPRMCSETLYGQGYFTPRSRVLVIGLGGGPDLQCALYQEAKAVDVVEINRDSIAAIRGPLNSWVGGIGSDPRVRFHERDGRSFVHGRTGEFDLIQLSGVDTKNNLASGAFALSENSLYTLEAFRDYLRALSPDGALSLIRFGDPEALRLAQTAIVALRELKVEQPEQHIAIARTGVGYGVVIRKKPFTAADADIYANRLHPPDFRGMHVYYYSQNRLPFEHPASLEYLPTRRVANAFNVFFIASASAQLESILHLYPWDVSPTTDDRPFFFDIWLYSLPETWRTHHVVTLRNLLLSILVLSLLMILLPLRWLPKPSPSTTRQTGNKPWFFACIGLGFVLLEVWLLHRFTAFLGHQIYSLSVVLSTLLVSTGLGASLGGRLWPDARRRALIGTLGAALLLAADVTVLSSALELTWHATLPVRVAVAIMFIAPLGLLLGQPFVAGVSWLHTHNPGAVPWCIGINGFCSVIASVAVIPLLLGRGYSGSLAAGVAVYLVAATIARSMRAPAT